MATSTNTNRRQGNLNIAGIWSYSRQNSQCQPQIISESFIKKRQAEYRAIYTRNISSLQENIFKIFQESLHSDLYIIYGSNVLQTNCCIIKTRSQHLYSYLEKYFTHNKKPIKCNLNTPDIFHQIAEFVRLLYCNFDVSTKERCLINSILQLETAVNGRILKQTKSEEDVADLSTSKSEMADSGLETSVSLHENTENESENSATDFEESHVTDYVSTDDDFIRVSLSGDVEKSSSKITTIEYDSNNQVSINTEGVETISRNFCACGAGQSASQGHSLRKEISESTVNVIDHGNQAQNNPFDNADSAKNGSFMPTESFEYIEPGNFSPTDVPKHAKSPSTDEKLWSNPKTRIVDHSNGLVRKKSFSSINSYCFIDASTLNDEPDVATISLTLNEPKSNFSTIDHDKYIPSRATDPRKLLLGGHDTTAHLQHELELTECVMPVTQPRKIKRVDSITEEKAGEKPIEKETLVVEIKEADSGESNHPSPCIDNNKRAQREVETNETENSSEKPTFLIRRNTFELDSGNEKLSQLRQEYERRQGSLVFKNSIPQYSGHRVDGDLSFDESNYSSLPYFPETTVHSEGNSGYFIPKNQANLLSQSLVEQTKLFDKSVSKHAENPELFSMAKSVSDKFLSAATTEAVESIDCSSLPITFNVPVDSCKSTTIRRSKCDEMTPIVSGGVSIMDYSRPTESPPIRRKTESTPIVSGGSVLTNSSSERIRSSKMSSSMNAWVVDMSDCTKNNLCSSSNDSSSMSQSFSCSDSTAKSKSKSCEKQASLGFFVNLKDIDTAKPTRLSNVAPPIKIEKETLKESCEFFIDISDESEKFSNNLEPESKIKSQPIDDTKNIFPLFIDLGESSRRKSIDRVRENKVNTCELDESKKNFTSESSPESRSEKKLSVFMYIDSDSPVVRRRTLSTSRPAFQRHSWSVDKCQTQSNNGPTFSREHKRAHSVSIEPGGQRNSHGRQSGSSSASLTHLGQAMVTGASSKLTKPEALTSHIDNVRVKPRRETDSSIEGRAIEDDQSETSIWDKTGTTSTESHTRKSETFDISSGGSGSGPSPSSDNNFPEYRTGLSTFTDRCRESEQPVATKVLKTHKSLTETIKKIECEFSKPEYETPDVTDEEIHSNATPSKSETKDTLKINNKPSSSNFVRLSDLDKTPIRETTESDETVQTKSLHYRMSSSIPEISWVESKLAVNSANEPCHVRTLSSRKFVSIMSTSLPAKHKSPIEEFSNDCEGEGIISESDLSSMQSSMGRSGADVSTEETETSSFAGVKQYNRLGEDLLRMFLEEINPDVTIDVSGQRIRAHKCILSSRCQYFAAILSGGWVENAGNVIALQGYSYNAVHFALCHIYSGESNIPDSISIIELATLADMLCLEGLKEVIGYTIKVKYCHLFHKPCQLCAVGVLECMPVAAAYGLDEVYRKSLRWITRHFVRIWPCKAFASLPKELMDKCYHQHIVHMSADNVLQTIMDCDKLLATLPNVRWAEPVFKIVSNLLETGLKFLSENFSSVLSNESFQALDRDLVWNISRLEDNVLAAAGRLPPNQACKSYSKLHKMLSAARADDSQIKGQWGPLFVDFLDKIQAKVEKCLVKEASRAARTTTWMKMDLELRQRIQELACLVILPHEVLKRPSRHSNFMKEFKTPPGRTSASRSLDLRRVKMSMSEQNDKTSKSSISQIKAMPKPKTDPLERKMPEAKSLPESTNRPKSWPNKLEIKSRYLEPRTKSVPKGSALQTLPERALPQQRRKIMISSSDSSRTSSPAMKRATDKKSVIKLKPAVKKDIKALSTDSLADGGGGNASSKRDPTSKSCGITRPESPSLKTKDIDIGLSADSLAETKKKPLPARKANRLDSSMSTDSLMAEGTGTPKSNTSNKISPTLGRPTAKSLALERAKKSSPPLNQKSPLSLARRPVRSVESSTASSRNRVAAISAYHGSPNLRRTLLDAAKTPDTPGKLVNGTKITNGPRHTPSTSTPAQAKRDRRESNPSSSESPSKRSPKSLAVNRPNRTQTTTTRKQANDKIKTCHNGESKQLGVGSRSGTFLKDEPTILKKSDLKNTQVMS